MIRAEASCNILDLDYDNIDQPEDATDTTQVFFLFTFHFSKTKTIPCTSWEYDTSFWRRTIIMDFDLVCSVWETWKIQFFLSLSSFRKFTWESYSNKWLSSASCLASPSLASSVTGGKFVNLVVNDDGIRKHFIHFCSEVKIVKSFCSDRCTSSRIKNCLSLLQLAVSYQIWKCVSEQTCRVLATAIRENNLISTSIIIAAQKT